MSSITNFYMPVCINDIKVPTCTGIQIHPGSHDAQFVEVIATHGPLTTMLVLS